MQNQNSHFDKFFGQNKMTQPENLCFSFADINVYVLCLVEKTSLGK